MIVGYFNQFAQTRRDIFIGFWVGVDIRLLPLPITTSDRYEIASVFTRL